jgi:hypothetical protein
MTHAEYWWADKLPDDRKWKFWWFVEFGFTGETAYDLTISHQYG